MEDIGFNGSGSRFNSRFESGAPITAKQLNNLADGIQASLPIPYLGGGVSVSFTPGGSIITNLGTVKTGNITYPWQPRDNGNGKFSIYPATINSLIPCIDRKGAIHLLTSRSIDPPPECAYVWNEDGECYIYLKAGPSGDADSIIWPSSDFTTDQYPIINGYDAPQNDSDAFGHILLALAQKDPDDEAEFPAVTFTQFIFNSIWSERHKYSQPNSAFYYFYRV